MLSGPTAFVFNPGVCVHVCGWFPTGINVEGAMFKENHVFGATPHASTSTLHDDKDDAHGMSTIY